MDQKFDPASLAKNKKFVDTIKTFAVYGAILYVVDVLAGMILASAHFYGGYEFFNVFGLIYAVIIGAIGLGVAGIVFYFIYEPVRNWVKKTPVLAKHVNSLFALLWKPYLVIVVITALIQLLNILGVMGRIGAYGASFGFGGFLVGWIVFLAVEIGAYYWFAKMISTKLGHYYPW